MPERPDDAARMDAFHDAVDRLAAGQPAPFVDDDSLQELLDLAGRLRAELPPGMPDPAFRESLKRQLIEPGAPIPIGQRPRRAAARKQRFPYAVAAAAIAAVFLAAVAVGMVALVTGDDDPPGVAIRATQTGTEGLSTLSASASPTEDDVATDATPTDGFGGQTVNTTEPEPAATATQEPPSTPATETTPSAPTATLISTTTATEAPTPGRQLAMALPPVNSTTVESGPVPLADPGAGGTVTTMTYELAAPMPESSEAAPVFLLTPPDTDPEQLVAEIARGLGLDGEVQVSDDNGKPHFHVGSNDGASFHWWPETGVFSYSAAPAEASSEMSEDEVLESCRGWLSVVGYPMGSLKPAMEASPIDNTNWLVETPMEEVPQTGFGHPLGVRMIVNTDGEIVDAKGYWVSEMDSEEVELITPEEAWQTLLSNGGFWHGAGGAYVEGGSLRVESIELTYLLTNSDEGLVLQPVWAMRGEYAHVDGVSTSGVTVFIQAARMDALYHGP